MVSRGVCPKCKEKELYTHAITPRMVKCGRINKCGYEEHVKEICEELLKTGLNITQTTTNPHAAADAYLKEGRGFDILKAQGTVYPRTVSFTKKQKPRYRNRSL
jgi:hypothetical protein